MTIQFKTNTVYTLSSRGLVFKLECTYIEGSPQTTAFFKLVSNDDSLGSDYKVIIKSNKLYKWSSQYMSWDTVENTLSEDKVDIWQARSTHRYASAYDGSDQTLNGDD